MAKIHIDQLGSFSSRTFRLRSLEHRGLLRQTKAGAFNIWRIVAFVVDGAHIFRRTTLWRAN